MSKKKDAVKKLFDMFKIENLRIDEAGNVYYLMQVGNAIVAIPLKSKRFDMLVRKFARELELRLSKADVNEVRDEVESMAFIEESESIHTSVRATANKDGSVVLYDLGDSDGNVVQLSDAEAKLVEDASVTSNIYFRRPETMQPMVLPEFNIQWKSELQLLQKYINTDKITFWVLLGYLTYIMAHPKLKGVPFPILVIQGLQGSGKSFFCNNVIRALLDPNSNASLRLPKRDQDLAVQLDHTYLAVYDNLRSFNKDISDLLCLVATKSGLALRAHYSYDDLASKEIHAPLVLNGIHAFIKESDLASRCFRVVLNVMKPEDRRPELQLKSEFEGITPKIMGALFTLSAKALAEVDTCEVKFPARIMDFSKWLAAVEKVLGIGEGLLQKAYQVNVAQTMAAGTEDDSLTMALQKVINKRSQPWKGSPSDLLEELQEHESPYHLPRGAGALTQRLKAQESSLNANSIYLEFGRSKERYIIVSNKKLAA